MSEHDASEPDVIRRLYDAFTAGDGQAMEDCYAADATFRDPVFELRGAEQIGAMWKMLIERGSDLVVQLRDVETDGVTGRAHWEASYTFATGRKVHNKIDATFTLRDGKIVEHVDAFSFWRWSAQALGPLGLALGWTPMVRNRVRTTARRSLQSGGAR